MKLISRQDVDGTIGKIARESRLPAVLGLKYYSGCVELDNIIASKFFKRLPTVALVKHADGVELMISHFFKSHSAVLRNNDIIEVTKVSGTVVSVRNKSIVGRGIIGGMLFGQTGAIVGGLTGVGTTINRSQDQLKFFFMEDDQISELTLLINPKSMVLLNLFLIENFGDQDRR